MSRKKLPPREIETRLEQGRMIRLEMERRDISYPDLLRKFGCTRQSIHLALRTHQLPTLRSRIERYVMNRKQAAKAA